MIPFIYMALLYVIFTIFIKLQILRKDKKFYIMGAAFLTMYLSPGIINILLKSMLC